MTRKITIVVTEEDAWRIVGGLTVAENTLENLETLRNLVEPGSTKCEDELCQLNSLAQRIKAQIEAID